MEWGFHSIISTPMWVIHTPKAIYFDLPHLFYWYLIPYILLASKADARTTAKWWYYEPRYWWKNRRCDDAEMKSSIGWLITVSQRAYKKNTHIRMGTIGWRQITKIFASHWYYIDTCTELKFTVPASGKEVYHHRKDNIPTVSMIIWITPNRNSEACWNIIIYDTLVIDWIQYAGAEEFGVDDIFFCILRLRNRRKENNT